MGARRFFVGCGVTALVILVIAVVGGVVGYKRLTAPMPLPDHSDLIDPDSVGHGVMRLDPDNPWIRQMFAELSNFSTREPETRDLFPIEVVWTARRASSGAEGHILIMSFAPRGRLVGMMTDVALWRAGRSDEVKVERTEYGGEGITAFPGTWIPGDVFVRGNSIVWASDLDTARKAVDLLLARERSGPASPDGSAATPASVAPVLRLVPAAGGHALVGAISGEDGAVARTLRLLPGGGVDLPEEMLGRADLSFVFDASSGDVATGEVTLAFPQDAPPATVADAADELAGRIAALKWGDVTFEASPRTDGARAILAVKASGLGTLYSRLLKQTVKVRKTLEGARTNGAPEDPNQSSSTFQ